MRTVRGSVLKVTVIWNGIRSIVAPITLPHQSYAVSRERAAHPHTYLTPDSNMIHNKNAATLPVIMDMIAD